MKFRSATSKGQRYIVDFTRKLIIALRFVRVDRAIVVLQIDDRFVDHLG
jgi:hypothetical protein